MKKRPKTALRCETKRLKRWNNTEHAKPFKRGTNGQNYEQQTERDAKRQNYFQLTNWLHKGISTQEDAQQL